MARRSYRAEQQMPFTVLSYISKERPGSTWSDIWRQAQKMHIPRSSETLARKIKQLTDSGFVLHEGKYYRVNPNSNYAAAPAPQRFDPHLDMRRLRNDFRKGDHLAFFWGDMTPGFPVGYKGPGEESLTTRNGLRDMIESTFALAYRHYIETLQNLMQIKDGQAARDFYELHLDLTILPALEMAAAEIWQDRKYVSMSHLEGTVTRLHDDFHGFERVRDENED